MPPSQWKEITPSQPSGPLPAEWTRPEDFGGGQGGDDTDAFQACAALINAKGGGMLRLTPGRTYTIGRQTRRRGTGPAYVPAPMFIVSNCSRPVFIKGDGARVKLRDGLRYGSFHPATGLPYRPTIPPNFTKIAFRAATGAMFSFRKCAAVWITDLEVDGNSPRLILGGEWGDHGRQIPGWNLHFSDCAYARLDRVWSHHAALDNLYIRDTTVGPLDVARPHLVLDSLLEFGGRQAMSWTGGRGLHVERTGFNHTGRAINEEIGELIFSSPGAGLDVEATAGAWCRQGHFIGCDFINNAGPAVMAEEGDAADCVFDDCTLWGTTSRALWPKKPRLQFIGSRIYGSLVRLYSPPGAVAGSVHPDAPRFVACEFEDKAWHDGQVQRDSDVRLINTTSRGWLMESCRLRINSQRVGLLCNGVIRDTTIDWASSDRPNRDGIMNIAGSRLENVTINDLAADPPRDGYFVAEDAATVVVRSKIASASAKLKWKSWSSRAGGFTGRRP